MGEDWAMTYRIYKANGTKCVRRFESLQDALGWCFDPIRRSRPHRIEYAADGKVKRFLV